MYIGIISVRYAKALYEYAVSLNVEDEVYKEMLTLKESLSKLDELNKAISNPILSSEVKQKLIEEAAGGNVCSEMKRFITLILSKKRENVLVFMINSYCDIYRKHKNISIGKLITAYPVADEVLDRIRKIVVSATHGSVEFVNSVNPAIEGGFIFEIGTYRLDASVVDQMRRVKAQFIDKNRRIV